MVKIVCRCCELKLDDYKYKNLSYSERKSKLCDEYAIEDARHMVMHCNYLQAIHERMLNEIKGIPAGSGE